MIVPNAPSCPESLRAAPVGGRGQTGPARSVELSSGLLWPWQRFCSHLCKDRAGHRRRYGAKPHLLTCRRCSKEWTRPAQTGRLPHACPECRATTP